MSSKQVILITGASSGFGLATATLLAQQGYKVFGTSRRPEQMAAAGFTVLPLDVTSAESIQACVQQVLEQAGRIDVLINNAGYLGPVAAVEETSLEQARALLEANFFGAVQMINAVLPGMRQQGRGQIINVSSSAGRAVFPGFGFYAASKHALEGYTEALHYEVQPFNIHVSLVEPGWFKTNLAKDVPPPGRPLDEYAALRQHVTELNQLGVMYGRNPKLVAQAIAGIIHSPVPGLRYPVGLDAHLITVNQLLPQALQTRMVRWMVLEGDIPADETITPAAKMQRLGLRRYFFDSRLADDVFRKLTVGLLVVGGLFIGFQLLPRKRKRQPPAKAIVKAKAKAARGQHWAIELIELVVGLVRLFR